MLWSNRRLCGHVLTAGLALALITSAQAIVWDTELVYGGSLGNLDMTGYEQDMVFDAAGHIHVAHTSSFTLPRYYRYSYYDGAEWHTDL